MEIKVFTVPVLGGEQENEEMNQFIRSHNVLETESQLVSQGGRSYWTFCLHYGAARADNGVYGRGKAVKIDYKQVLSPEVFRVFDAMRRIRKELSENESTPAYNIFNNEELARLAALESPSLEKMGTLEGIGKAKVEKYGMAMLPAYAQGKTEAP